jgi:hypothetical protein
MIFGPLVCVACGRRLVNDEDAPNAARWTYQPLGVGDREPYCGDSADCQRDAEQIVGVAWLA